MAERNVYLTCPARVAMESLTAARGFFFPPTRNGDIRIRLDTRGTSLLPHNFNQLWAAALTYAHRGNRVDVFAMQHADVGPCDTYWLDTLLAELDAGPYDVVSAVIPIKDSNGLTSTAVGLPPGLDDWRIEGRLTMTEVWDLDRDTFTAADLGFPGRPLLINTGLWVARWGDWCREFHFREQDRIEFNPKEDCYAAEVIPEDWDFGRRLHALGLKVAATRKVRVLHQGFTQYDSGHAWGEMTHDEHWRSAPMVPARKPEPEEVPCG